MQLSSYRLADYRLAAYVVAAAVIAGGATFAFDRVTAPKSKLQANGAPPSSSAVRQIPIARTSAADLGDPDGKLTPVYPASPGKDLPIKDTPVIQVAKPPAITTGSASTSPPAATATPVPVANATPQANACNVAACAAAYRSFREADCSYQPFEGPRRYCEGAPDNNASATAQPSSAPPSRQYDANSTAPVGRGRYDEALRDVERTVRRLPRPGTYADVDDGSGVTVIETPRQRYDLRRNWISEPED